MKNFWRVLFTVSMSVVAVSVILLLNFTAPNPTGRRYSSEMPVTTGQGNAEQIGLSGERILSRDLGLPRNETPAQCICSTRVDDSDLPSIAPVSDDGFTWAQCSFCITRIAIEKEFRRPDFVNSALIVESKNVVELPSANSDLISQIRDYATAALATNRTLWIYTRTNTEVAPEFIRLAESTGGGVVPYFTVPGYVDPVDQAATAGLLMGGAGAGLSVIGLTRPWRRFQRRRAGSAKWEPKDYPEIIEDAKRKAQETIDKEDSRLGQ
jgi:hypothetical protein